jgi:glyoxylase-like metal-dependent hydrolase (beta-lactamase superfamily II)
MRTTFHGQYLSQLTRFPRIFPVNCYLVKEHDGLTLIDTAIPACEKEILNAAKGFGLPITRIVLTHAHGDHIGSQDALHALLPAAEVLVTARDARFLCGDMSLDPTEPQTKLRGSYQKIATHPTRIIVNGDHVGSLEVISTPGHTPGHIALFDDRDGSLIVGDAFQTRAGIAVAGVIRPLFPFPAMATWNRSLALESARKLRNFNPSRLAVGHGNVLENPVEAIEVAIAEAEQIFQKEKSYGS